MKQKEKKGKKKIENCETRVYKNSLLHNHNNSEFVVVAKSLLTQTSAFSKWVKAKAKRAAACRCRTAGESRFTKANLFFFFFFTFHSTPLILFIVLIIVFIWMLISFASFAGAGCIGVCGYFFLPPILGLAAAVAGILGLLLKNPLLMLITVICAVVIAILDIIAIIIIFAQFTDFLSAFVFTIIVFIIAAVCWGSIAYAAWICRAMFS
jgi:hypothetical protein